MIASSSRAIAETQLFDVRFYLCVADSMITIVVQDFEWRAEVKKSSAKVPLVHAHNFSLGVNLMCKVICSLLIGQA